VARPSVTRVALGVSLEPFLNEKEGRAVTDYSETFVGLDVAKARNAVAIADAGRDGEVRYWGEVSSAPQDMERLVRKLARRYRRLHFCYEAGCTGYGLYRQIKTLGHACTVAAPSLIPVKAGERRKTNRIDALKLAKLLRSGDISPVWVPDEAHEALRDLVRTRGAALKDLRRKRQFVSSFLLRHGRFFPGKKAWGRTHAKWLAQQSFTHPAQTAAFHDMVEAASQANARLARLEGLIEELVPQWSLAPVAAALQAVRGFDVINAVTFLAEVGDLTRFEHPRQLMAYLGLIPSEDSTGDSVRRGPITKTGNNEARRVLVEAAWCYRFAPKVSAQKLGKVRTASQSVQAIAWKAQMRLTQRYRRLLKAGKNKNVVVVALARELSGFLWAIAKDLAGQNPGTRHEPAKPSAMLAPSKNKPAGAGGRKCGRS
jgi:transposase